MTKALKVRQICFFYIAIVPAAKFFMMASEIAAVTGEDLWISVLANFLLDFITVIALYFCLKDENCDFFTALENRFGKTFGKTVAAFYAVYFILKTLIPLNEQKDYVELTLYMTSPDLLTFLPIFGVIYYVAVKRLRVLGRIADGTVVISLLGYIVLFSLSVSNADFGAFLPVGAHGAGKIAEGAFVSQNWFGDGVYFAFFAGEYVKGKKDLLKILLSVLACGAIILTFVLIFYGTFGAIAARQRFALTETSKYSTVINYVERFDYISIFALLFTAVFSLALPFYFATDLLARIFPIKKAVAAAAVCLPVLAFTLLFNEYYHTVETFIMRIVSGYFLFFGTVFPVAAAIALKWTGKKGEKIEVSGR